MSSLLYSISYSSSSLLVEVLLFFRKANSCVSVLCNRIVSLRAACPTIQIKWERIFVDISNEEIDTITSFTYSKGWGIALKTISNIF